MSNDRKWHSGPPPHVGWWNASVLRSRVMWRWWDGMRWSAPAHFMYSPSNVARAAACPVELGDHIEWSDYYPPDARVPRVDPSPPDSETQA